MVLGQPFYRIGFDFDGVFYGSIYKITSSFSPSSAPAVAWGYLSLFFPIHSFVPSHPTSSCGLVFGWFLVWVSWIPPGPPGGAGGGVFSPRLSEDSTPAHALVEAFKLTEVRFLTRGAPFAHWVWVKIKPPRRTAGLSPWFHETRVPFGYLFLNHNQVSTLS